jgi:AhpD family alkylhydroperoxidase
VRGATINRYDQLLRPALPKLRKLKDEIKDMFTKENLIKLKKMEVLAPEVMKAFWAFDKASVAEGAIPVKYKELIAVGVALTTQCPYCIDIHSSNARKAGATDTELAEAAMVAASLRAGAAVTHATHALVSLEGR